MQRLTLAVSSRSAKVLLMFSCVLLLVLYSVSLSWRVHSINLTLAQASHLFYLSNFLANLSLGLSKRSILVSDVEGSC